MEQYYTDERNVQILIALLKEHGIKRVVASPGSTNVTFVGSIQQDSFFEIYSSVDERSAAYIACGIAAETKEPVVLSCTGATASRNYFPGLTEAYYRKLSILAVTSTQEESKIGQLIAQVIDRRQQPFDTVRWSEHLQTVKDKDDEWNVTLKANRAILELVRHGGGPVHINLTTRYSHNFTIKNLPSVKKINRYMQNDRLPAIPKGKIAVYIGSHLRWSEEEIKAIDEFCMTYNAVAFCDTTANYNGKYRVNYNLASCQKINHANKNPDLLIHIGDMSDQAGIVGNPKEVWRVSPDGDISDRYKALKNVFEMTEESFFAYYSSLSEGEKGSDSYLADCIKVEKRLLSKLPNLPFSHIYVASQMHDKIPQNSTVHLGILSPLRSWSYFDFDPSIELYCNQGGFGIDGNMSTMVGASLVNPGRLFFAIVGDLSFFYDMNVVGNRHVGKNIRILLINNALGAEFHLFKQLNSTYVKNISRYLSAGGHFGNKSSQLIKHYAEDLGYEYLTASNKEEFLRVYQRFLTPQMTESPMLFEVFTQVEDENEALKRMWEIESDKSLKGTLKKTIKDFLGKENIEKMKDVLERKV